MKRNRLMLQLISCISPGSEENSAPEWPIGCLLSTVPEWYGTCLECRKYQAQSPASLVKRVSAGSRFKRELKSGEVFPGTVDGIKLDGWMVQFRVWQFLMNFGCSHLWLLMQLYHSSIIPVHMLQWTHVYLAWTYMHLLVRNSQGAFNLQMKPGTHLDKCAFSITHSMVHELKVMWELLNTYIMKNQTYTVQGLQVACDQGYYTAIYLSPQCPA